MMLVQHSTIQHSHPSQTNDSISTVEGINYALPLMELFVPLFGVQSFDWYNCVLSFKFLTKYDHLKWQPL